MPPVGFEPTISAGEWPQTHVLDSAATGDVSSKISALRNVWNHPPSDTASHPRQYRCQNLKFRNLIFIFIHWRVLVTPSWDATPRFCRQYRHLLQAKGMGNLSAAATAFVSFRHFRKGCFCFLRLLHARTVEQTFGLSLWKGTIHWSCSLYYRKAVRNSTRSEAAGASTWVLQRIRNINRRVTRTVHFIEFLELPLVIFCHPIPVKEALFL